MENLRMLAEILPDIGILLAGVGVLKWGESTERKNLQR